MTKTVHVWAPLNRPELALLNEISDLIHREEWRNPDALNSVRRGPTMLLTCDYGGMHRSARYETLAFLVADLAFVWLWDEFRRGIRAKFLSDRRRLAYKQLGDRNRAKAAVPFLRASNTIPGLLIVFAIDKQCLRLLSEPLPTADQSRIQLGAWKAIPFERLTRVGLLGAMLVAAMSAPHQNVLWFTDQDAIAPNVARLREATAVTAHYIAHLCGHTLGHVRFGTTECDDGTLQLEDLAALPDMAAGAVSELLSQVHGATGIAASSVMLPAPRTLSKKSRMLTGWLADRPHPPHPLRKMLLVVEDQGNASHRTSIVRLETDKPLPEFDWGPEVQDYMSKKLVIPGI